MKTTIVALVLALANTAFADNFEDGTPFVDVPGHAFSIGTRASAQPASVIVSNPANCPAGTVAHVPAYNSKFQLIGWVCEELSGGTDD